jgi:hypothetical protein
MRQQAENTDNWRGYPGFTAALTTFIFLFAALSVWMFMLVPSIGEYGPTRPFPEIRDGKSLRVTLERSGCFWGCPSYTVAIHGDGTVIYDGIDCVTKRGRHTDRISREDVATLVTMFREANYFSLHDSYVGDVSDSQTVRTSIRFDENIKVVEDYVGESVGMPRLVTDLERDIDRIAGTKRWVDAGPRTCRGRPAPWN